MLKKVWDYLKRYKKILSLALLLATVNQVFSLLDPQIFRLIVDKYASRFTQISHSDFLRGVILLLLASVGVALVSRIAKNFQDYYVNVIIQKLGTKLYAYSVEHSFSLPYAIFEDQRSGELLLKLQKAREDTQNFIQQSINTAFLSLIGIIFVMIYAFIVHWQIGFLYFLTIPFLGFATFIISRKIKTAQKNIVLEKASLAGSTTETIRNVELVKSLGLEQQEINRLNEVNEKILQLELKKIRLIRFYGFIQGTLINGLRSALLLLMLWLIYYKAITLGQFFSLFIYSFFIFNPLSDFGDVATAYREASASLEQLDIILQMPSEPKPKNSVTLSVIKKIQFKNVNFRYHGRSQESLNGLNFSVNSGQIIAFAGPSGSGKTTLIKLVAGLYKPSSGQISINNISVDKINYQQIRSRLGLVSQETQLFAGSIRENLLFIRPDASDEKCMSALEAAAVTGILSKGDRGLDTRIGEGGLKLSGGERQRLAIARALLRQPDLIIFDEATSNLDSITEQSISQIIKDIAKKKPNLITMLIAHRLSTIIYADIIFVMEHGRIIERGSHKDLLIKNGLYAALWRQQVGGRS